MSTESRSPERKPKLVITFDDVEPPSSGAHASAVPSTEHVAAAISLHDLRDPDETHEPGPGRPSLRYTICGVREVSPDPPDPHDGLILPVPGRETDSVVIEDRDGLQIQPVVCSEIKVLAGANNKRLLRTADIRARVLITDARLTVACTKFDKGGGWVGSPVAMVALNAGSKLLAAHRRRGKMLVGQVRYPWIHGVYAQNKAGWTGSELLRIIVNGGGEFMRLELTLPKDVDATAVATEVIQRAARFRLAHEHGFDNDERARLRELASIPPLVWRREDNRLVGHQFPSYWPAGEESARFGLAGGGPTWP